MDLVNQPRGVSEPTHVVPIRQAMMYTRPCSAVTVIVTATVTVTVTVTLVWAYAYDHLIEFHFRRVVAI